MRLGTKLFNPDLREMQEYCSRKLSQDRGDVWGGTLLFLQVLRTKLHLRLVVNSM